MELYLLLLLHSRPHVESGLLVGVQVWVLGASGAPGLNGFMQHCLRLLLSVPFSGLLLAVPKSHTGVRAGGSAMRSRQLLSRHGVWILVV